MKHKIDLDYIKALHKNACNIEDKIIYLSTIIEELYYLKLIDDDLKNRLGNDIEDLIGIRNNLLHLRKNSLKVNVWESRELVYNRLVSILQNYL